MLKTIIETYLTFLDALFGSYGFFYEERKNRRLSLHEISYQLNQVKKVYNTFYSLVYENKEFDKATDDLPEEICQRISNAFDYLEKIIKKLDLEYRKQHAVENHVPTKYQQLVPYNSPKAEA